MAQTHSNADQKSSKQWKWLKITAISEQPISFGTSGEHGFLTHTHPYLPGSVIRGALAAHWFRSGKNVKDSENKEDFKRIFQEGHFGPAYPEGAILESQSVSWCKYHNQDRHDHEEYVDAAFEEENLFLEGCDAGREMLKGGFREVSIKTNTTTALEAGKNKAQEGSLYSRQTMVKGTVFTGHIVLPGSAGEECIRFLEGIGSAFFGGRTSVMGRASVEIKTIEEREENDALGIGSEPEAGYVIRTLSPAILVDEYGLPSVDIRKAIARVTGIAPEKEGVAPEKVWSENPRVESGIAGGWHSASGLPKPSEVALTQGIVARFGKGAISPEQLKKLLATGIGLRTNEGYGWVEIVKSPWTPRLEKPDNLAQKNEQAETQGQAEESESLSQGGLR